MPGDSWAGRIRFCSLVKKLSLAQAFDEWMRAYREAPHRFANTLQTVRAHDLEREGGGTEYGEACSRLIEALREHGDEAWETIVRPEPPPHTRKRKRRRREH